MKSRKKYMMICITLALLAGCVDPFDPEVERYDRVYVVDGELSNLPGPYEVRVSQSTQYGSQDAEMVTGATVIIMDDENNQVTLSESSNGVYTSEGSNLQGVPGRKYKLRIEIAEEVVLESDFEELKEPVEIAGVYWEFLDRSSYAGDMGLEMYLDSETAQNALYYAWEYEEYWKFESPYTSPAFADEKVCWDSSMTHSLVLGTTAGYSEDAIKRKNLYFISNQSLRLTRRYTTLVRQYVLTETAYNFYKDLKALNENTGSLFDPIPFSLEGNMTDLNNPEIPVLGLFQVAGVSQKRIYIDLEELPDELEIYDLSTQCQRSTALATDSSAIEVLLNSSYVPYDTILSMPDTIANIFFASKTTCFRCTEIGTNQQPDFWEE